MIGATWASGTTTRFTWYGVAMTLPLASRIVDRCDTGARVNSFGRESKTSMLERVRAPAAPPWV